MALIGRLHNLCRRKRGGELRPLPGRPGGGGRSGACASPAAPSTPSPLDPGPSACSAAFRSRSLHHHRANPRHLPPTHFPPPSGEVIHLSESSPAPPEASSGACGRPFWPAVRSRRGGGFKAAGRRGITGALLPRMARDRGRV